MVSIGSSVIVPIVPSSWACAKAPIVPNVGHHIVRKNVVHMPEAVCVGLGTEAVVVEVVACRALNVHTDMVQLETILQQVIVPRTIYQEDSTEARTFESVPSHILQCRE